MTQETPLTLSDLYKEDDKARRYIEEEGIAIETQYKARLQLTRLPLVVRWLLRLKHR